MAFQTLADSNSNAALALRDQADILQSTRFGQSARRSLVLQSLFNEQPGALPVALDVYGDGAGETGAATPQNGVVSSLTAQKPSYNDYGALFSQRNTVQIDSVLGSRNTGGEQVRAGVGSDTLGVSLAQQYFTTDGFSRFNGLDNRTWQGVVQWRPVEQMQAFVLYEDFKSNRGYVFAPADVLFGTNLLIRDRSKIARLGARYSLNADDEVRVLLSQQRTGQLVDYYPFSDPLNSAGSYEGSSRANAVDVQYRTRRFGQPLQLGAQIYRSDVAYLTPGFSDFTRRARQVYISSQQTFNPQWQLDWSLGWGQSRAVLVDGTGATTVQRVLPRLGVVYTPDTATHIRLAAWQGIGMRAVGDADLAPVSVAGIVQTRPSDAGKLVRAAALALDRQLGSDWLLEAQAQTRKTFEPAADGSGGTLFFYQKTDVVTAGMHWQPHTQSWTLGVSATYEKTRNDENALANDDVDKQTLRAVQLDTRWFISPQWRAQLVLSRNWVAGYQQVPSGVFQVPVVPTTTPYGTVFNQADVAVVWQLPQRLGQLQLGVRNLGDTRFQYTDPDPLTPRFSIGRLVYGSMKLMW